MCVIILCTWMCAGSLGAETRAHMPSYDVEAIAEGLLSGETQFTDLTLHYVANAPVWLQEKEAYELDIIQGCYFQKLPEKMQRLDKKVFRVKNATGERTMLSDRSSCFNGEATLALYKNTGPGLMRARIFKGYEAQAFGQPDCPHDFIWKLGRRSFGSIIRENKDTFHVENDSEMVENTRTIKLSGVIMEGRIRLNMWISPSYNFLPLKVQFVRVRDGRLGTETALSDLIRLPNGLWYPRRIRTGSPDPNEAVTCTITEISIEPIPKEVFTPKIPPGTLVFDYVLGLTYATEVGESVVEGLSGLPQQDGGVTQKVLDEYVSRADEEVGDQETGGAVQTDTNMGMEPEPSARGDGLDVRPSDTAFAHVWKVVLLVSGMGVFAAILIWFCWKRLSV
jgi:hypothetical protein